MSETKKPYFPPATRVIGTDEPGRCILTVYGESGAGKSHLGYQLLNDPDFGPEEVLFFRREEASTIYGPGAHVLDVETFADVEKKAQALIDEATKGTRMPKVLFVDSWTGLALGTQAYLRKNPIEEWNEKRGEFVKNKYAEFGVLGTGSVDDQLAFAKLPMDTILLATTWRPPGGLPELALEGKMIPKFLSQLCTSSLYLSVETVSINKEEVERSDAKGTLRKPHRIVEPWKDSDLVVPVISRFLYSQNTGEVIAKGHRNLRVKEPAYLPRILRRIHGRPEPKESPYFEGGK